MPNESVLTATLISGMVVQTVGLIVLAGIIFGAYRAYGRGYLAILAMSWLALAVFQCNGVATIAFGAAGSDPLRQAFAAISNACGYLHIAWLLFGVHGLTTARDLNRRHIWWISAVFGAVGLLVWGFTVPSSSGTRFFVRMCVRSLVAGLVFLLAASQVLTRRRRGMGRWLVAGGFTLYALDLLQYFALGLPGGSIKESIHLGYIDILAQMGTGLGLVILMLEDERERAAAAAELLDATHHQRLHSGKMEALGRMAGGVSHDFNNLLTAMRGHLELALERTPHTDQRRADLEQAWRAAERACHLTQQLLSFSRSRPIDTLATCDIVASLRELEPLLVRLVGPGIEIRYDLPDGPLYVGLDRTGLEQVVFNLAANARDAMPNGGYLTLLASQVDDPPPSSLGAPMVEVSVADTGCGMDAATRARIFDPFFTTKPPGFGTGLGLAQVYGIVQQARGHIECRSAPGQGTVFDITVPRSDAPAESATPFPEPTAPPDQAKHRDQVVMLVDDDALVRQLLCRSLREHGYTVIEAADPIEALTLDAEFDEPIDLLVTDLAMPKLSGTELAARICERRPNMRLLFISGFSASHTPNPDVELLQKPFAQTTFLARIDKLFAAPAREGRTARTPLSG
ncbi:MAG: ATP-binding protein [Planctomycetota bacterium]